MQDQLNQAAAPHGLLFGPDTSTSNRATIGGMTGNNSAGSGSLRYGMTIDHVRALEVVLSDGSTARLEPVDEAERARRAQADTLEGRIYRGLPEHHASATPARSPRTSRRSGGGPAATGWTGWPTRPPRSTSRSSSSARRARSP